MLLDQGVGKACSLGRDCASSWCSTGDLCVASNCTDGVKDGDESDVDCGGSCVAGCATGKHCNSPADCAGADICFGGICKPEG